MRKQPTKQTGDSAVVLQRRVSRRRYEIKRYMNDDLVLLWTAECGEQLWTKGSIRKQTVCAITGKPIEGKSAWRPITNVNNRWRRISPKGMVILKRKAC